MRRFHTSLLVAFGLSVLLLTAGVRALNTRLALDRTNPALGEAAGALVPGVASAAKAKRLGLFWAVSPTDKGSAISLLDDAALFEQVFPGYGAIRADAPFWRHYRRFDFDARVYAPRLSASGDAAVMISWAGCFEIMRRHGSQTVLLGSSEVYSNIVPHQFARKLGGSVLSCAAGGMTLSQAALTARRLADSSRRARLAVWGFSSWNARRGPAGPKGSRNTAPDMPVTQGVNWTDWLPISYQEEWNRRHRRGGRISLSQETPREAEPLWRMRRGGYDRAPRLLKASPTRNAT